MRMKYKRSHYAGVNLIYEDRVNFSVRVRGNDHEYDGIALMVKESDDKHEELGADSSNARYRLRSRFVDLFVFYFLAFSFIVFRFQGWVSTMFI